MPGPLTGVRVLELGTAGPGPFACMVLSGLGASVLRIDRPDSAPMPFPGRSVLSRGRTRLALDLKRTDDRDRVLRLVDQADVLVEGFRSGVTERLGLGPAECASRNPRLVYARMSGWGQDGPNAQRAAHDLNLLAESGALAAMVDPAGSASYPLSAALTFGGGSMFLVSGILAALYERTTSGLGQVVDAAIADGLSMLLASSYGLLGKSQPPLKPIPAQDTSPFYGTYVCADGKLVAVAAAEDHLWRALRATLGVAPVDRGDPASWPALRADMAAIFAGRTQAEWVQVFSGIDAAFSPVLELADASDTPQTRARASFVELDGVIQPTMAPQFSRTQADPPAIEAPASTLWTEEVLAASLVPEYQEVGHA